MRRAAALAIGFVLLASCSPSGTNPASAPGAMPNAAPGVPAIGEGEPFTVSCNGVWRSTDTSSANHFRVTIYPQLGKAVVFDLGGYNLSGGGTTYSTHRGLIAMEDIVTNLSAISATQIIIGRLNIDRQHGRFNMDGLLEGRCQAARFVPKDMNPPPRF